MVHSEPKFNIKNEYKAFYLKFNGNPHPDQVDSKFKVSLVERRFDEKLSFIIISSWKVKLENFDRWEKLPKQEDAFYVLSLRI